MNTIEEIRRANLDLLLAEGWKQADIARAMQKDPRQVSQWFGKGAARAMSSETARDLEAALRKPRGWMDHPQSLTATLASDDMGHASQPMTLDPDILREAYLLALQQAEIETGTPYRLEDDPGRTVSAYSFLVSGNGGTRTASEVAGYIAAALQRRDNNNRGVHGHRRKNEGNH